MIYKLIICLIAGFGAGIGTGFAGMSAAAVIAPMLITFLDMDPYMAVGIALAGDVLSSAVSAYTYRRHHNLDVKNGLIMMVFVLLFTVVGSWTAQFVPDKLMGNFSMFITLFMGIRFLVWPVTTTKEAMTSVSARIRAVRSALCGMIVGFICGFVGAGGGMMMLILLISVLGYELKTAVGTSVFIMTFTALTGAASHFVIAKLMGEWPDTACLVFCVLFTLIFAIVASRIANRAPPARLNRIVGTVLVILAAAMLTVNFLTLGVYLPKVL